MGGGRGGGAVLGVFAVRGRGRCDHMNRDGGSLDGCVLTVEK